MSGHRSPWQDGRRAWARLNGWYRADPTALHDEQQREVRGREAFFALADLRLVRGLLDQAEYRVVTTARRAGRPWSEIAAQLGASREYAQSRWGDVDGTPASVPPDMTVEVHIR